MARFEFRLQKVLEYREILEQWAKDGYLEARAARLEAEAFFETLDHRRATVCANDAPTLEDRLAIQRVLERLDDEESQQRIIVEMLTTEEEAKRAEWLAKRQELESLAKLREDAVAQWRYEQEREEQKSLDDWTASRRVS